MQCHGPKLVEVISHRNESTKITRSSVDLAILRYRPLMFAVLLSAFAWLQLEYSKNLYSARAAFAQIAQLNQWQSNYIANAPHFSDANLEAVAKAGNNRPSNPIGSQVAIPALAVLQRTEAQLRSELPPETQVLSDTSERDFAVASLNSGQIETARFNGKITDFFGMAVDLNSERNSRYDRYFQKYTEKYFGDATDWRWFKVQAFVESGLRMHARSTAGAVGIMQVMPQTYVHIQRINSFFREKSLMDEEWNIAAGIYYNRVLLRSLVDKVAPINRLPLMFASYNAGMTRIMRSTDGETPIFDNEAEPPKTFPRETQRYLKKLAVLMQYYRGYSFVLNETYAQLDSASERGLAVTQLAMTEETVFATKGVM